MRLMLPASATGIRVQRHFAAPASTDGGESKADEPGERRQRSQVADHSTGKRGKSVGA